MLTKQERMRRKLDRLDRKGGSPIAVAKAMEAAIEKLHNDDPEAISSVLAGYENSPYARAVVGERLMQLGHTEAGIRQLFFALLLDGPDLQVYSLVGLFAFPQLSRCEADSVKLTVLENLLNVCREPDSWARDLPGEILHQSESTGSLALNLLTGRAR